MEKKRGRRRWIRGKDKDGLKERWRGQKVEIRMRGKEYLNKEYGFWAYNEDSAVIR